MPKKAVRFLSALVLPAFLLPPVLHAAPPAEFEKQTDGIILQLPDGFLNVQVLSDSVVRVAFSKDQSFFGKKTIDVIDHPPSSTGWKLSTTSKALLLSTSKLTVSVDRVTGTVKFLDAQGKTILAEAAGGRFMQPAQVQGEDTFHVRQQWLPNAGESLYGLGQHQFGIVDIKGTDLDLWQRNTTVIVPFLVSSDGYGILWDNTSYSRFGDLREFSVIPAENLFDKDGRQGGLTKQLMDGSAPMTTASLAFAAKPHSEAPLPPEVTWEGSVEPPATGDYQFQSYANGCVKIWIDGRLILDHWRQSWLTAVDQAKLHLEAKHRYPVKIEWTTEQGTTFRLLWKTPSAERNTSLWSEVGDGVNYYFVYGPKLDDVVAGYRFLTGQAPMMPSWAFGLWQSRQRYETAQQSLDVVDEFRRRGIPFDNIVQDWQYWPVDAWGSHKFDPARFPDPDGWIKAIHERHAHLMISVWGKFYTGNDNFKAMLDHGYLYPANLQEHMRDWIGYEYTDYDAFNADARRLFWEQVNSNLFRRGIDAWWMDATEPDLTPSPPTLEGQRTHMQPTAMGTASRMMNGYPLMNSMGVYTGQRGVAPNQRVFILTRSAFAGQQRYAAASWSGDITSTWTAMAKQIPAGLGLSISGLPYWTMDIGGYTMQDKFSTANPKPEDEEEWRELNARWFEFGTFCPLLRVHGELRPREMWTLGGESHPAYQAELKFDRLRYRMFPYVYSLAGAVTQRGGVFMRPLVMDFAADAKAREIADEYMFGPALLVAPVTQYKARTRSVYLPQSTGWYDFWTGKAVPPGTQIEAAAPYDSIPLFVRAGSIVPFGPELQYIAEKPPDPIALFVYAGADGSFTLYEDQGLTYDYEKGAFSEIPIEWNDATQTLKIGERKGSFDGMLQRRKFEIVLVSKDAPVEFSFDPKPIRTVEYEGAPVSVKVR
ncbi:MAG: TIM-barrel domain-containing protein [Terracidiphilus sp.]|jgi:alpha-D-xyloside xylohydrolase